MRMFLGLGVCFLGLILSFWLMRHTLSYDPVRSSILVGAKYWSDFGNTLPLIRSFSYGGNWPPQHPLFPGEPIRYHFLFHLLVGLLERAGLRLDWALNIPSALGFFSLLLIIFSTTKLLFIRTSTAFLSVGLFLFNSSFSWLDYLRLQRFNLESSIVNLKSLSQFPAFAPWNSSQVAAFWNLNIYTNQRHLALSFAIVLVIVFILYTSPRRLIYLIGFLLGLLLLLNQAAFLSAVVFALWFFVVRPPIRFPLIVSSIGLLPWAVTSLLYINVSPRIIFKPGFLQLPPITALSQLKYWFFNFGFHLLLLPLGFLFAPRRAKILIPPLLLLFLIPNLFQFSPDMINNHKFFNIFLTVGAMFSAFIISRLKLLWLLFPFLVLGGIVDFFPLKNDRYLSLLDYPANPDVVFFKTRTPSDTVVLNSLWFYHPASLAGRKIFNGYSYFTWSFGYNQVNREKQALDIYRAPSKEIACKLLISQNISYVELSRQPEAFIQPNWDLWLSQFTPAYSNPKSGLSVYDVSQDCP